MKGISSGDFQEALSALLGADAPNLSADAVLRLRKSWRQEQERWERRDLSARHYVYLWADGVYFQARMDEASQCMLVIIGATPEGRKELVGFTDGYRESAQSWRELLVELVHEVSLVDVERWDPTLLLSLSLLLLAHSRRVAHHIGHTLFHLFSAAELLRLAGGLLPFHVLHHLVHLEPGLPLRDVLLMLLELHLLLLLLR